MSKTPEQVGPYRIVSQIGRGGMAVVYLARQPALGRSVALKELAPFLAGDPSLAQRFIREARVAGSLNHPNIVTVFDFLEQDGTPYIAMEYLERGSLRPFVGRTSLAQVAGVLEGLLAALSHAEAMNIVHRDVKPENLLVTPDGGVKIADFGIAKALQRVATEEMLTPAGATVGTPAYMAPEQAMAQEIGPWTDLYQTGVVAYELLAGDVPFSSDGAPLAVLMKHITDPVPALPAGTDPALTAWVTRMLAKDPSGRPPNARSAWEQLEDILVDVQGPLWRRDARLGEHEPTVEHPTPLTPARFSSWQDYVADPSRTPAPPPPEPPRSGSTGHPSNTPAPPPPEPPGSGPTERPSPAPAPPPPEPSWSGYIDYLRAPRGVARDPAPPHMPERPAPEPPPAEVASPTPEPPPAEVTPPTPEPPPAEVAPPEPTTPDAVPLTGFFDNAPEPPPAVSVEAPVSPPPVARPEPLPPAEAPTVGPASQPSPPPRRTGLLGLGVLGLLAAAVVALLVLRGGDENGEATPPPTATATPSGRATPPAGPFAVGDGPDGIAVGAGAVWAVASRGGTLTRIDPATGETASVDLGDNPDSVVVAFDAVWVSVTGANKVLRISAEPRPKIVGSFDVGERPEGLAASSRAIWVANSGDGTLSQIIEATGEVRSVPDVGGQPVDLAIGAGAIWVADAAGSRIARVDGGRRRLVDSVPVGPNPRAVAIIGRDVWAATTGDARAWRIDGDATRATGDVRVGGTPRDIATDGARLFVTDREGDRVVTIDPQAMRVVSREPLADGPLSVAPDERDLWVTRFDGGDVARLAKP